MIGPDQPVDLADRIELRGLRLIGICGALPEERDRAQPLEIDLDVYAPFAAAESCCGPLAFELLVDVVHSLLS